MCQTHRSPLLGEGLGVRLLKKTILVLTVAVVLVMMAATIIEAMRGTDFAHTTIYSSVWFVALWGVLAVTSTIYIIGKRLHHRPAVMLVHAAFLVILAGALLSWLTAESGQLHLRKGEPAKMMALKDGALKQLDFTMELKSFHVENYPGTDAAMDYVSEVIADGQPMEISMNNIGQYHGYRFLQASYDSDMQGSVLTVYHDPWGIAVTYTGYLLLLIGFVWMLFSRQTRLRSFYKKAVALVGRKEMEEKINVEREKRKEKRKQEEDKSGKLKDKRKLGIGLLMIAALAAGNPISTKAAGAHAQSADDFHHINIDRGVADDFGRICVLYNSRICPINTVATDFVTKLSGRPTWNGFSANEVFAGWVFDVTDWENARMIKVQSKEVQHLLGIDGQWASFNDFWNEHNEYKLEKPLADASNDKALQKKLRETDEKFNIIRMLYGGELLRMFPYTDERGQISWLAPGEKNVAGNLPAKEWNFVRRSMDVMAEAVIAGNTERAKVLADKIYNYQHIRGEEVMPSQATVYAELVYTAINTQRWPVMLYLSLALLLVVATTFRLRERTYAKLLRLRIAVLAVMLLHTTLLLALRWWVSGHLPLSNGFETMQLMAWLVLLFALIVRRRFLILSDLGILLAAFALLVAMLTDSNPQLTQLMPVLQSPLLSIHVMVIMFSYSLFGLMALIGIQGLLAHREGDSQKEDSLAALSLCMLYPAVALLAIGIFIGAVWANVSWGRYWSWDSKETWALITMLIYAAPLHNDIQCLRKPTALHAYLLLAFLSVLMTYFGVNYFLGGMHSYA